MRSDDGPDFPQISRREWLAWSAAAAGALYWPQSGSGAESDVSPRHNGPRPRIAAIYTELRELSHAYHILHAHLGPYLFNGRLTDPGVDVVSWYADQFPEPGDMTREASARLGVPLYDSIEAALTCGGNELAVDGVLLIGEHGQYPRNELGQQMYPRKEFFDAIVAVMDQSQRYVPIFNDKHLSYRWDWAKEMYDTAQAKGIPFMAGTSVTLAQRMPDIDVPLNAEIEAAVAIHGGPLESYDFHGLEVLQSFVEKRRGGEAGITSVQVLEGDALLDAAAEGRWSIPLAEAAMRAELGDAYEGWAPGSSTPLRHGILLEYADGFRAAVLAIGNSGTRWTAACQLKDQPAPVAVSFFPGPWGNRNLFRALSHAIQEFFITGRAPYPVERTLLTTGVLDAAMHSHHEGNRKLATPQLVFPYAATDFTAMRERGASWTVLTEDTPKPPRLEPGDVLLLKRQSEQE
ncbi:MAG: hypothetical protein KF861_00495 [Planctomycetaceae bacterium]|nr:hypothetical protein [Planctomycetaceae bacterium]